MASRPFLISFTLSNAAWSGSFASPSGSNGPPGWSLSSKSYKRATELVLMFADNTGEWTVNFILRYQSIDDSVVLCSSKEHDLSDDGNNKIDGDVLTEVIQCVSIKEKCPRTSPVRYSGISDRSNRPSGKKILLSGPDTDHRALYQSRHCALKRSIEELVDRLTIPLGELVVGRRNSGWLRLGWRRLLGEKRNDPWRAGGRWRRGGARWGGGAEACAEDLGDAEGGHGVSALAREEQQQEWGGCAVVAVGEKARVGLNG
ncbi:hypothetical protein BHE74_00051283 [Ensete ventricosum]|nr:hypothetical protein BHE74_00051283 [Ensete ventricosum]